MWLRWDPEKTAIVRELYPTHSASIIARLIGEMFSGPCTRNSVIGIAHRMKLKKGAGRHSPYEIKQKRPLRRMTIKPKPTWKPAPEYAGPPIHGIQCQCQVIDLEYYNCRWPYGDPRQQGFYFCGAVVAEGRQYCPTHHKQAHGREVA